MSEQPDHPDTSMGTSQQDLLLTLLNCSAMIKLTVKRLHEAVGNLDHCATLVATCLNQLGMPVSECSSIAKGAKLSDIAGPLAMRDTRTGRPKTDWSGLPNSDLQHASASPLSTRLAALAVHTKEKLQAQSSLDELIQVCSKAMRIMNDHPDWTNKQVVETLRQTFAQYGFRQDFSGE